MIQLYFAAKWILISEVTFISGKYQSCFSFTLTENTFCEWNGLLFMGGELINEFPHK